MLLLLCCVVVVLVVACAGTGDDSLSDCHLVHQTSVYLSSCLGCAVRAVPRNGEVGQIVKNISKLLDDFI